MRHAPSEAASRRLRLVHTSDLHLFAARAFEEDLAMVRALAATVAAVGAHVVAIAGDLFDHNRVPAGQAAELLAALAEPQVPVVILPGNHDPLTVGSIHRRAERPSNVFVLGLDGAELAVTGAWRIAGRAHLDYGDFPPLARAEGETEPGDRIVLAHGHYDLAGEAGARHRPGWLITDTDLDGLAARYVGLGHWDRAYEVRRSGPPTYYSGSPWLTGSVNVVDVGPGRELSVERVALQEGVGAR